MKENRGIIYFNVGTGCLVRILVSLFSLRKHYNGPVSLLHDGDLPEWVKVELKWLNADIVKLPAPKAKRALVRKSQLWRYTPYRTTLFFDADTLILADPSPLFKEIEKTGIMTYHFSGWKTTGGKIARRIKAWHPIRSEKQIQDALNYGKAVNTGIHGYVAKPQQLSNPFLEDWERTTVKGYEKNCTRILVDELAWQILLPYYDCTIVGEEWGCSVKFGNLKKAKIIHYHGKKHVQDLPACAYWKSHYWEYRHKRPDADEMAQSHGDRRLRQYLDREARPKNEHDITIVSAVNAKYMKKLRANFAEWQKLDAFKGLRYLIFWNEEKPTWLEQYDNVDLVHWRFAPAGDNVRERMLSAFVFGVAKRVKTRYWLKLDADATPKEPFQWPDYKGAAITGHRWGYTRVKGDPAPKAHWLNTLDNWYGGDPVFPANIDMKTRHGHKRINSYCCIEDIEHTKMVAEKCQRKNDTEPRLPVPSQDTTSWYVAYRAGKKINRVNMKRCFSQ